MLENSSLLPILAAIFATGYFAYHFYLVWFDTEKLRRNARKSVQKLPSWYPFKKYYRWRLGHGTGWTNEQKVTSIFAMLFILLIDVLVVRTFIYGN